MFREPEKMKVTCRVLTSHEGNPSRILHLIILYFIAVYFISISIRNDEKITTLRMIEGGSDAGDGDGDGDGKG